MTPDEKLAAILAAVQTDPGNRGLARVPGDNLFTATAGDFQAACRSIAEEPNLRILVYTGFYIPTAEPPAFETDGPLGAVFLWQAFERVLHGRVSLRATSPAGDAMYKGISEAVRGAYYEPLDRWTPSHYIWVECAGPAADGKYYTMRGRDISTHVRRHTFEKEPGECTIGIGDGGNEIGMGKIPHDTVVANIPNGDLIHCRVPTDHLIVAGVSNWGAYALAAGVFVLRGVSPPADLFDPDREREILDVMVREGPLVDGVTGRQTATVDGLTWDEYAKPLVQIGEILRS